MTAAVESTGPLRRSVRAATEESAAHLGRLDPDALDDLDLEPTGGRPVFVVVGETKRGKSSLVNALLGVPDLSPVDTAVATSAYLEFTHAEKPAARAIVPGRDEAVPIDVADLPDWATVPGRLPEGTRPPRRIEIGHPAPLLERLSLVDTPGTGGLHEAHAEVSLEAAARASALVFVADASAPLAVPELDFLVRAAKRVNVVVFVLAKTDAYPGWRTILAENQAALRTFTPRFANAAWFPVSAHLAALAGQVPDAAEALLAESHVPELRDALCALADKGELLAEANALRAVRGEFVRLDQHLGEQVRAVDPDTAEMERVRVERAALADRRRVESRQWPLALNAETNRARVDSTEQVRTRLATLQEHLLGRIDKAGAEELKELPQQVDRSLAALSVQLSRYLEGRFQAVGDRALAEVFGEHELAHVLTTLNASLRHSLSAKPRRDTDRPDTAVVVMSAAGIANMAGHGAIAGASAGAAALGLSAVSVMVPVFGVGLGLAAGAFLVWKRRAAADRQQARVWLREVLGEARAALNEEIAHRFTDLQYALTLALDEALAKRIKELDANIADIDRALAEDRATRDKRRQERVQRRDEVRGRVRQIDEILVRARQHAIVIPQQAGE